MTKFHPMLAIFLIFMSVNISFSTQAKQTIIKNPNDSREYHTFILENGMEVLLASDPSLTQAAASLTVGVGQYQDPESQQGLAHYVEHMIFMGSKFSPQPNQLQKFVQNNNGHVNAVTEAQQTSYFFSINSDQFDTALNMLSSAIKAPLFNQAFSKKELKALDAEWQIKQRTYVFSMHRVNALTAAKKHPMRKMGLGNLSTLSDKPNSMLQTELQHFHQKYYSANIMKLALVGKQSLKELKTLASKHFGRIPNKQFKRAVTSESSFTTNDLSKHIYLITAMQEDFLSLQFPLKDNSNDWETKPNRFIYNLLISEEPSALVPSLREAGLIESMQVAFNPINYGIDGDVFISFVLTEQGKEHKNEILSAFFNYINLIKKADMIKGYEKELQNIFNNQISSFIEPAPLALAYEFSHNMLSIPTTNILRYGTYFTGIDETAIQAVLAQITPQKMRLWHLGPNQKTNTPLKFAKGAYRITDITSGDRKKWENSKLKLKLPDIATVDNLVDAKKTAQTLQNPKLISNEPGVQSWLMHSQHFENNQGRTMVTLDSPIYGQDVKHHVMTNLFLYMLNKDLQLIIQRASQRHQVYLSGTQNKFGNIFFTVEGTTERHSEYLQKLLTLFKHFSFEQQNFDRASKLYRDSINNIKQMPLGQQVSHYASLFLKQPPSLWNAEEMLPAIDSVSLNDMKQFHQKLLANIFIDVFSFGNYDSGMVQEMGQSSRALFGDTKIKQKTSRSNEFKPVANTIWDKRVSVLQDNVFLKDIYIYPEKSEKIASQLVLLNQLFNSALFKDLRTNKQLGYIIESHQENIHQYPAMSLYIQSANTDLQKLKEHVTDFIIQYLTELKATDEATINQTKTAMINALEQKPQNIYSESSLYLHDWLNRNYNFDYSGKRTADLQATSKKELIYLYKKMFIESYSTNIYIQLKGKKFSNTDYFNNKKL